MFRHGFLPFAAFCCVIPLVLPSPATAETLSFDCIITTLLQCGSTCLDEQPISNAEPLRIVIDLASKTTGGVKVRISDQSFDWRRSDGDSRTSTIDRYSGRYSETDVLSNGITQTFTGTCQRVTRKF